MRGADNLGFWLLLWALGVAIITAAHWRRKLYGVGLVLGYLLNLSLIHFTGAAVYLNDDRHLYDPHDVVTGLRESTWGLLAFGFGSLFVARAFLGMRRLNPNDRPYEMNLALPKAYLVVGTICYLALATFLKNVPTLSALIAAGQQVFLAGLCLLAWKAWKENNRRGLIVVLIVAAVFPFLTMMFQGFIGFGAAAMAVVYVFVASLIRPRWKVLVAALVLTYLGLSVFVTYSQDRAEIREVVWGGQAVPERFERIYLTTVEIEWFDSGNPIHLEQLDRRLNQNHLVGAAVEQLGTTQQYGNGDTIAQSIAAIVPRFIWPEKDIEAGSGDLVSKYTGLEFNESTSVGIGHILEFYVNFGSFGVVAGMMILGTAITVLDVLAARRLAINDWRGFGPLFLVGVAFLHVGGSLVELTSTAGASLVLVLVTNAFVFRFHSSKQREQEQTRELAAPGVTLL